MTKACSHDGCTAGVIGRGLCRAHYWQQRRATLAAQPCTVSECARPLFCAGLCRGHYARRQRGVVVEVPLQRRPEPGMVRLTCRLSREVLARLTADAAAANVSPSVFAAQLLAERLGVPPR